MLEDDLICETSTLEENASHHFQEFDKHVADLHLQRSDSEPGVDTVGIYVENNYN